MTVLKGGLSSSEQLPGKTTKKQVPSITVGDGPGKKRSSAMHESYRGGGYYSGYEGHQMQIQKRLGLTVEKIFRTTSRQTEMEPKWERESSR